MSLAHRKHFDYSKLSVPLTSHSPPELSLCLDFQHRQGKAIPQASAFCPQISQSIGNYHFIRNCHNLINATKKGIRGIQEVLLSLGSKSAGDRHGT